MFYFWSFQWLMFLWRGRAWTRGSGRKCVLKGLECLLKVHGDVMYYVKGAFLVVPLDALLRLMKGEEKEESYRITRVPMSEVCFLILTSIIGSVQND